MMSHIDLNGVTQKHLKDEISNWRPDNIDSRNFSSGLRLSKILKIQCLSENLTKLIFFHKMTSYITRKSWILICPVYFENLMDKNLQSIDQQTFEVKIPWFFRKKNVPKN